MEAPNTTTVHYFDVDLHTIPCGAQGFEERSTKHSRNVTCQACRAFLQRTRPAASQASGLSDAASHAW